MTSADKINSKEYCEECSREIHCALTWQHIIEEKDRPAVADDLTVRGRFEWDDETDGQLPLIVIDGKAVTWDEFGRILKTFEG